MTFGSSAIAKRILVINGHPDGDPAKLCAGLSKAYGDGAAHPDMTCAGSTWLR